MLINLVRMFIIYSANVYNCQTAASQTNQSHLFILNKIIILNHTQFSNSYSAKSIIKTSYVLSTKGYTQDEKDRFC